MKLATIMFLGAMVLAAACESGPPTREEKKKVRVVKDTKPVEEAPRGGIPPDKMAEIETFLQLKESAARRCYQDVLNEKHTRSFQGSVKLVITLEPGGKVNEVKILGGTLNDKQVTDCLLEKIRDWEFPQIPMKADYTYEYRFAPAY